MKNTTLLILFFLVPIFIFAQNNPSPFIGTNLPRGSSLRILRLAVSANGEFTQSVPGANDTEKKAEVLRQMKIWLAEINIMYGREYSVRFELIPDNILLSIIYPNAATDPWPNMSGGNGCDNASNILNIQASTIDGAIGAVNYDISHVILGNFGGGCAGGFKTGYSGGFDIPVTRHEMGHQFSQAHTINNGSSTNYEPENAGRSVHGGNTDPYAHSNSYHQLANHLINTVPTAGTNVATGNTIPTVNAGADRSIPISTPFTLTATATDPDVGDNLTYVWDQLDGSTMQSLPAPTKTQGALFSRLVPSLTPSRTYPKIINVIANVFSTAEEDMPTLTRDLNFRLTVNDNHQFNYNGTMVNQSGTNSDDIKITVVNNGGAFSVTSQSTAVTYTGGTNQTITWNVSGTNLVPISTSNVKISLSADGGFKYPIVLTNSTANTGSAVVIMPNINTTQARIKVEAVGNYFFAINSSNFTINQNTGIAGIGIAITSTNTLVSENGQTDTYTVKLLTNPSGAVTVNITADAQTEISLDGTNFGINKTVSLSNITPRTITVRGKSDNVSEGFHLGLIQQTVSVSADPTNYPVGMAGQPVSVNIADAQIPPIIGIDFDATSSTTSPTNWLRIADIRNQTLTNIPLDDGTPTDIDLTTSASDCGVGGCGFASGNFTLPQHAQSLTNLTGVTYARGTATFTWSGLQANTKYLIFVFGLGVFGPMNQNVTITGSGTPIAFIQNAASNILLVNDQVSSTDILTNFSKTMTSSPTGTITITATSNLENTEMSFAGIGIRKVGCPNNDLILDTNPVPTGLNQAAFLIQSKGTVQTGTNVTFLAGKAIELTGVFKAQNGSVFEAKIGGCQ
ncbi:3-coathanger stack domain-containing protein [Emticicia sp.]|uniref:3-coathanger stack domain-containing protein n=1 Tax=Emticicia sp. TaxID=1930953 RepID=UPI00375062B8